MADAFIDFAFEVPEKLRATIASSLTHATSTIRESVHEDSVYQHTFISSDPNFVDSVVTPLMLTKVPTIRCRYGCGDTGTDWHTHYLIRPKSVMVGAASNAQNTVLFEATDLLGHHNKFTQIKSRTGSISKIVTDIFTDQRVKNHVIEKTADQNGVYVQSNISDVEFIRKRLIVRAANARGRGNYRLFCRDDVVHFHSPDYQASVVQVSYDSLPPIGMTAFDHVNALVRDGAAGTALVTYDPLTGKSTFGLTRPDQALKLGSRLSEQAKDTNYFGSVEYHVGANRIDEARVIAQNVYEAARNASYSILLPLENMPLLRAGDILKLVINTKSTATWSGVYLIESASHEITKNTVKSIYQLNRGEYFSASVNDAPGDPINLAALSSRTKEKGQRPRSVEVADPQRLPR
jgi:hypothetical protein